MLLKYSWAEFRVESRDGKAKWVIVAAIYSADKFTFQIFEILDIYESFHLNKLLLHLRVDLRNSFIKKYRDHIMLC